MKLKLDIKSFKNITRTYDQLLNLNEVPNGLKQEFLNEADAVLRQCYRIIEGYERAQSRYMRLDSKKRRVDFEKRTYTKSDTRDS